MLARLYLMSAVEREGLIRVSLGPFRSVVFLIGCPSLDEKTRQLEEELGIVRRKVQLICDSVTTDTKPNPGRFSKEMWLPYTNRI